MRLSLHKWSPYAQEQWYMVTSIDDYSRKLLFADFFPKETTWTHIQATQAVIQRCGFLETAGQPAHQPVGIGK